MKLLIDNALSPIVARRLRERSVFDVVHVRELGMQNATDEEIFARAASENRVIVSADTDFGTLLAVRNTRKPSVVLLRRQSPRRPERQAILLSIILPRVELLLEAGAIVVVEENRVRVRSLPLFEEPQDRES